MRAEASGSRARRCAACGARKKSVPEAGATRRYVYEGTRGDVGVLAVAVAKTADSDPVSREILRIAGNELARMARVMIERFGPRPVALTGRAAEMHPHIAATMRELVPAGTQLELRPCRGHHAAAHLAMRAAARA